jgi:hypothetical protein
LRHLIDCGVIESAATVIPDLIGHTQLANLATVIRRQWIPDSGYAPSGMTI